MYTPNPSIAIYCGWGQSPKKGSDSMSIENHPNIHAVWFTLNINDAMVKHLRGDANQFLNEIVGNEELKMLLVDFVANVSTKIDEIVEAEKKERQRLP